ncbi:YegS/Rv2252/BmrU family lipid kinase [candidate division WOR-3 bacterium]|uniref:YegS/Rv2252/BmrU family lipid kinase n=1 Tax=candidate division WOR-3 bacterium TaxID=2052148 RepID=A0A9D5K8E8_UNCW3|nr:YegS/Rv2252/BmrU family lipid kinase [candidate division WOR-3 bacterium]MBD3364070.1 YegS/Rv2252/BmrU family lipid kinase [candidate division WOR-3 bacterium]
MKVRFLVNPSAGKGRTAKRWSSLFEGKGLDVRVCPEHGMIAEKTKKALHDEVDRLVIVGGDGSMNHALNAFNGADVELGVVPTGSGNDFARTAGIEFTPPERYLEKCSLRRVDVGKVQNRLFINIFGSGFDADVAKGMQESSIKGDLGYLASVLKTLGRFRSPKVTVQTDRERIELEVMTVSVGNGRYHGGMFMLTPSADITDGELDLCLVRKISKTRFVFLIPKSTKGRHVEVTDVVSMHRFKRMKVAFSRKVYYHVDGEMSDTPLSEMRLSILPNAQTIVVP